MTTTTFTQESAQHTEPSPPPHRAFAQPCPNALREHLAQASDFNILHRFEAAAHDRHHEAFLAFARERIEQLTTAACAQTVWEGGEFGAEQERYGVRVAAITDFIALGSLLFERLDAIIPIDPRFGAGRFSLKGLGVRIDDSFLSKLVSENLWNALCGFKRQFPEHSSENCLDDVIIRALEGFWAVRVPSGDVDRLTARRALMEKCSAFTYQPRSGGKMEIVAHPEIVMGTAPLRLVSEQGLRGCAQNAALAHNLLLLLGVQSSTMVSGFVSHPANPDGTHHAYNLFQHRDTVFLDDFSIPLERRPFITGFRPETLERYLDGEAIPLTLSEGPRVYQRRDFVTIPLELPLNAGTRRRGQSS